MIIKGNRIYRSLEEQVLQNQLAIKDITSVVGMLGIKVVKQVDSLEDLPLPGSEEFEALAPGDAYAVGVESPGADPIFYEVKVLDDTAVGAHWLYMGTFTGVPGPEGPFGKSVFVTSQQIEETTTNAYLGLITLPSGRDLQEDDILLSFTNFGMAQVTGIGDESATVTYLGSINNGGVSSVNGLTGDVNLTASNIYASNSQTIQQNLVRIDERIDDYAQDNIEGSETVVFDLNEAGTKYQISLDQNVVNTINGKLNASKSAVSSVGGLVTPSVAPSAPTIVAVDSANAQAQIRIGSGLSLTGGTSPYTLTATGGGGDGDLFLVTITYAGGVYSADKTYAEILSARNLGKACVLLYSGSEYLFAGYGADTITFNKVTATSSTTMYGDYFTIDDSEQVAFHQNAYPIFNSITTYTVAPPTILLENNNTKVINYTTEPLTYTISTSGIDTSKEFITSIIFTATSGQHINEQIGAAYAIKYSNAITFTAGKTYEIVYRCLWAKDSNNKTIVSATWNEV